ncbi:MAG: site-specific integrase, partial [Acidobacteriota bacterium]
DPEEHTQSPFDYFSLTLQLNGAEKETLGMLLIHGRLWDSLLKRKAQKLSDRWEDEKDRGIIPRIDKVERVLFKDRAEWTLDNHYAGTGWYDGAALIMRVHLIPYFNSRPIGSIITDNVREYMASRRDAGRKPSTINREVAVLSVIMKLAWKARLIPENPVSFVEFLKEEPIPDRFLTQEEADALVDASGGYVRDLIVGALETGGRKSELQHPQLSQIDYEAGFFEFRKAKGGKVRHVPLSPRMVEMLRSRPVVISGSGIGYVFTNHGQQVKDFRTPFETARKQAGLGKDVTFHTLRRTFATWFMQAGGDVFVLRGLLGHSDIEMTMRYAKYSPAHQKGSAHLLGRDGARNHDQTMSPV